MQRIACPSAAKQVDHVANIGDHTIEWLVGARGQADDALPVGDVHLDAGPSRRRPRGSQTSCAAARRRDAPDAGTVGILYPPLTIASHSPCKSPRIRMQLNASSIRALSSPGAVSSRHAARAAVKKSLDPARLNLTYSAFGCAPAGCRWAAGFFRVFTDGARVRSIAR